MNTYTVTITSKNQITLPAKLVRQMKLEKNKHLEVTERKGEIIMSVKPSLKERMQKYKTMHHAKQPVTDEKLCEGLARIVAEKATK